MGLDNPLHIAMLLLIVLLVFGAKRLPELGRSLGSGMREFKQSVTGESQQMAIVPASQQTALAAASKPEAEPVLRPSTGQAARDSELPDAS